MEENEHHKKFIKCQPKIHNFVQILSNFVEKPEYVPNNIMNKNCDNELSKACMTPSDYMKQLFLNTEERMNYLIKFGRRHNFKTEKNELSYLQSIPKMLIFQQFVPGKTYNVNLSIRNISKVSQYLNMSNERDPFFNVKVKSSTVNVRLAPGMSIGYNISFTPEERRDYKYEITFSTELEKFTVSVFAIGPRPLLDFPDIIEIPTTAVKVPSMKSFLIRNMGQSSAIFNLYTQDSCFHVEPSKGIIEQEEMVSFSFNFLSNTSGNFEGAFYLEYESGEIIRIVTLCSAVNCDTRLSKRNLRMDETYLGLSDSKIVTIHNRSDYILKFQWMNYATNEEDEKQKEKYKQMFALMKDVETVKCVDLMHYDICVSEVHDIICHRIYSDEITSLADTQFFYNHKNFQISLMSGDIWPQSSIDVTIFFQPDNVGDVSSTAYLEITGRENRIPLTLKGTGKGPTLKLNVITVDIGNIFTCSVHTYEIICANKGLISGTLIYTSKPGDFGGAINANPSEVILQPGDYKSFDISFSSNRTGSFVERVDFTVKESLEIISMYIKGCVIYPTLYFDKEELDFGIVSLGTTSVKEVCLHNSSSIPITFSASVLDDGDQPVVTYDEYLKAEIKPVFPTHPQEFTINFKERIVPANDCIKMTVHFTPNILRSGKTILRIDMRDHSNSKPFTIPISFHVKVASFLVNPAEIAVQFCFVNYPYTRTFTIENTSDTDGYFYFIPQTISEIMKIEYSLHTHYGFLKSGESKIISMEIITKIVGIHTTPMCLLSFIDKSSIACMILCNGQGPVISVSPLSFDLGKVNVLQQKSMKLLITNNSPIPAEFEVSLKKEHSVWTVVSKFAKLESNESQEWVITAFLRDTGICKDELQITTTQGKIVSVPLTACGEGSCIVCEPNIIPIFDMGLLFSHQNVCLPIKMKNEGNRYHRLLFTNSQEVRVAKRDLLQTTSNEKFRIEPDTVELAPGASVTVNCKIKWNKNETIAEQWYLHNFVEGRRKRDSLNSMLFTAMFIEPHITFSKTELTFRMNMSADNDNLQQIDELLVTNESPKIMHTFLTIDYPFFIIVENEEYVHNHRVILKEHSPSLIRIYFTFSQNNTIFNSQTVNGELQLEYEENTNKDKIKCKAEINFPSICPIPKQITFNCPLGCTQEILVILMNSGPIPVYFKFKRLDEYISINRLSMFKISSMPGSLCEKETEKQIEQCEMNENSKNYLTTSISSFDKLHLSKDELHSSRGNLSKVDLEEMLILNDMEEQPFLIMDEYFSEDRELFDMHNFQETSSIIKFINKIINIVPCEGLIMPNSSQNISFTFHGLEPIEIKAVALCEVKRGNSEIISINAATDVIQYRFDKDVIEYGTQLFCEFCDAVLRIENCSLIELNYKVEIRDTIEESLIGVNSTVGKFDIHPNFGTIKSKSFVELIISYRPNVPGRFKEQLKITIENLKPHIVEVIGVAIFPQVYLSISRGDIFQVHSPELGYKAIQTILNSELISDANEMKPSINNVTISSDESNGRLDNEWEIISDKDDIPNLVDIEMAVERLLVSLFLKENLNIYEIHNFEKNESAIRNLYSPEYVIDMGYVVVGEKRHYTTSLYNYGPTKVAVKYIIDGKKDPLSKTGMCVKFRNNTNLSVGEYTILHIIFHPIKSIYKKKITIVKLKIFLEVVHGYKIPINIKAIVTYPYLIVNTKLLEFDDVAVGECQKMCLQLKNEGFVDCKWEACLITNRQNHENSPFYLNYTNDSFPPNYSNVMNIYFKPQKAEHIEAKLIIKVDQGFEQQTIHLIGRSFEHKLKISEPYIRFPPMIPGNETIEKIFHIENIGAHPLEFCWFHLDQSFVEEDQIAKALTHYYRVEEILLPRRKLGERLPQQLRDFYQYLIHNMTVFLTEQQFQENIVKPKEVEQQLILIEENTNLNKKTKRKEKFSQQENSEKEKTINEFLVSEESKIMNQNLAMNNRYSTEDTSLTVLDLKTTENHLHSYIDYLQKQPDFFEKMKDPVKEVFKNTETKLENIKDGKKGRKVCIIYHGAPFTKYQETACKSAKLLKLPLLNLNKAFNEMLGFGNSESIIKLKKLIDNLYEKYALQSKKYREMLSFDFSTQTEKLNSETEKYMYISNESILLQQLKKLPFEKELESMDSLSRYEYKMELICVMQDIRSLDLNKDVRKSARKTKHESELEIDRDILKSVLQERLLMTDFVNGFILQTLNNDFLRNNVSMLIMLLEITEKYEFRLFITFHNTMQTYNKKLDEIQREKEQNEMEEIKEKSESFQESIFEIENFSKDKNTHLEKISISKEEQEIKQQETDMRKNKNAQSDKVTNSSRQSSVRKEKSSKKDDKKLNKNKNLGMTKLDRISRDMDKYSANLQKILEKLQVSDSFEQITSKKNEISKITKKKKSRVNEFISSNEFYVWHIKSCDPWDENIYDAILNQIENIDLIKDITIVKKVPEPDLSSKVYSVLAPKKSRIFSPLETERTTDKMSTIEESPSNSLEIKSDSEMSLLKSNRSSFIEEPIKPCTILQPNELQEYKVKFNPDKVGLVREDYFLSIVGGVDMIYNINVEGFADIPRINMDPIFIFNKVKSSKVTDTHDPTYFLDSQIYDFGSLLVLPENKREHLRETKFKFTNISMISAKVYFSLLQNKWDIFKFEPQQLVIHPGDTREIQISATAKQPGVNSDQLVLIIEDNPCKEMIQLHSHGVKLDIELNSNSLIFDRVLLNRKDCRTLIARNNSPVTIFWRIIPVDLIESQIIFEPLSDWIKPRSSSRIEFCYNASVVGVVDKWTARFNVFLHEKDVEPLLSDNITVQGETYDVEVDVKFANPIDFKRVKVGLPSQASFAFYNRGSYEVIFEIQLEKVEKLGKLEAKFVKNMGKHFEICPATGSLLPKEEINIKVLFVPHREVSLNKAPILKCRLIDPFKNYTTVAEFPLEVSIVASYVRYRLNPFPDINFGATGVGTKRTIYLNIENIGEFPLYYNISIKNSYKNNDSNVDSENNLKLSKSDEKTFSHEDAESLKIDIFTISKFEGHVKAGDIDTVKIDCYSEMAGSVKKKFLIIVPQSAVEYKNGQQVNLIAQYYIPRINFEDLRSIFCDNYLVDFVEDFVTPRELNEHTIFSLRNKCLYFRRVCVSKTHTTCFKLYNESEVSANVIITIKSNSLVPKNADSDIFTIDPIQQHIPPMSSEIFVVSFKPKLIETYSATMEATVKLPSSIAVEKLCIKFVGEGCVPEIAFIDPSIANDERLKIINFNQNLVNQTSTRKISFKNVGFIEAIIIMSITEDTNCVYVLDLYDESQHFIINSWNNYISDDHHKICRLFPEDTIELKIKFQSITIGKFKGQLCLHIVNNPFENIKLFLEAEVYIEEVVLENLEIVTGKLVTNRNSNRRVSSTDSMLKIRKSRSSNINLISPANLIYKLDYGSCFLNKMKKAGFRIKNTSDKIFRFEWNTHPNIVLIPTIGHLIPLASKEIVVTFLTNEPTNHIQITLSCTVCEIILLNSNEQFPWDDRCKDVHWIQFDVNLEDFKRKVLEPTTEPANNIIPETCKSIELQILATAAYSQYYCDVDKIELSDTLMFQTKDCKFTLKNSGIVNLEYAWNLTMDEQYPIRLGDTGFRTIFRTKLKTESDSLLSSRSSNGKNNFCSVSFEHNKSDLFSSTACLTDRSTDSWIEGDNWPFAIRPERGILLPGESLECSLNFLPTDVFDYKAYLNCCIENLNPEQKPLIITVTGKSLLPYCHFDIPESDYLTKSRRDPNLPGPNFENLKIDQLTRVIEFKVLGTGQCCTKQFHLINPTVENYQFSWDNLTGHSSEDAPYFHCVTSKGIAERGKRTSVTFTFIAESVGTYESFWLFSIEKYDLKSLFLLVAKVVEPLIYCSTVHLNMKPTVIGERIQNKLSIINKEDIPLTFHISPDSLYSKDRLQSLKIEPMTGILLIKEEQLFSVKFRPSAEGEFTFALQCFIEKRKEPLTIFIVAKVYSIVPHISYTDEQGQTIKLYHNCDNIINFGKIWLKKTITLRFELTNNGKIGFSYIWNLSEKAEENCHYELRVSNMQGNVNSKSKTISELRLTAFQKVKIQDHLITLKIKQGPVYRLLLTAIGIEPFVKFNFSNYNFGPRYIQDKNSEPYVVNLKLTNLETMPCIVECFFEDKPYLMAKLDILSDVIPYKTTVSIPIIFRPLNQICYRETMTFFINSVVKKNVTITGEGISYQIRVENPCTKIINLGNLPAGKSITRKIQVVNEGRAAVDVKFDFVKILSPVFEKHQQPKNKNIKEPLLSKVFEIRPSKRINLRSNKSVPLTIKFTPVCRMKPFSEKMYAVINSTVIPLLIVRGSCIEAEFRLNRNYVSFGNLVKGSFMETQLVLMNIGDTGSRFLWNTNKLGPHFHIKPLSGYCSPGTNVTFVLTFQPINKSTVIQGEAVIEIEKYQNMNITLHGGCIKLPDSIKTVRFATEVRKSQTKEVNVFNDSDTVWNIEPEVSGDYFSSSKSLQISSKQSNMLSVTYAPLLISNEEKPHKGTLILKLAEIKQPILYELIGISLPPQAVAVITRQIPAKTKHVELLSVYNWMNKHQRFDCKIELINKSKENLIYSFTGNSKLDIPVDYQIDYRATFYAYNEGNYNFKVTFYNQEGEYQYYNITYDVLKPEICEFIKLTTTVRSPVYHHLKLDNPLKEKAISYIINCKCDDIIIPKSPIVLQPLSNEMLKIGYYPLLSSESIVKLDIYSEELGLFPYEIYLKSNPALPEKPISVVAALGGEATFYIPICNHSKEETVFDIKMDESSFHFSPTITVPAKKEKILEVSYEPYDIKNVTATLIANSETAGEFVFPISASYTMPRPQGPFLVTHNEDVTITFKNMFMEKRRFKFLLEDSKVFSLNTSSKSILPKESINIIVNLKNINIENNHPVMGKLIVHCEESALSHINWIYYLKGVIDKNI